MCRGELCWGVAACLGEDLAVGLRNDEGESEVTSEECWGLGDLVGVVAAGGLGEAAGLGDLRCCSSLGDLVGVAVVVASCEARLAVLDLCTRPCGFLKSPEMSRALMLLAQAKVVVSRSR